MALSKTIKEQMVNAVVAHGFDARIAQAQKVIKLAGDEVYKDVYGDGVLRTMMALPEGFLAKRAKICVNWSGQIREVELSAARLVAHRHQIEGRWCSSDNAAKIYELDNALMIAYDKACDALKTIQKERDSAKWKAEAVINSCSSMSKLWKVWPESYEILKQFDVPRDKVYLPAVQIPDLNAALGLPVTNTWSADNGTNADA